MLEWQPESGIRKVGHSDKRWSDDLDRVTAVLLGSEERGEWRIAAEDRDEWRKMEEEWMKEMGGKERYQKRNQRRERTRKDTTRVISIK